MKLLLKRQAYSMRITSSSLSLSADELRAGREEMTRARLG
jgi:hypothetical protein